MNGTFRLITSSAAPTTLGDLSRADKQQAEPTMIRLRHLRSWEKRRRAAALQDAGAISGTPVERGASWSASSPLALWHCGADFGPPSWIGGNTAGAKARSGAALGKCRSDGAGDFCGGDSTNMPRRRRWEICPCSARTNRKRVRILKVPPKGSRPPTVSRRHGRLTTCATIASRNAAPIARKFTALGGTFQRHTNPAKVENIPLHNNASMYI
jgi:hypothetical protein